MTVDQFKAWFEGISENIEYAPSGFQWERIKAKVAEVTETKPAVPTTVRIPKTPMVAPAPLRGIWVDR